MSDLKVNEINDLAASGTGPNFPDGLKIAGVPLVPYTLAEQAKMAFIDVSQPVNLDTMETDIATSKIITDLLTVTLATDLDAMRIKLATIETNAKDDQTGAEIKALYEVEANAFTDAQFTKLGGIEVLATADQTDAEIKTAYENNANTNAYTDAEQIKLGGIEALADVTDTTNVAAAGAVMDTTLTTQGDILIRGAAAPATRLALGTIGQHLASDGTDIVWQDDPTTLAIAATGGTALDADKLIKTDITGELDLSFIKGVDTSAGVGSAGLIVFLDPAGEIADNMLPSIDSTTGAGDSGKVVKTDGAGLIDQSFLPVTGLRARIVGDADYNPIAGDMVIFDTAFTAIRSVNLPAGVAGDRIRVMDGSTNASAFNIQIGDGADTFDGIAGPLTISGDYDVAEIVATGANTWITLK